MLKILRVWRVLYRLRRAQGWQRAEAAWSAIRGVTIVRDFMRSAWGFVGSGERNAERPGPDISGSTTVLLSATDPIFYPGDLVDVRDQNGSTILRIASYNPETHTLDVVDDADGTRAQVTV